MLTQFERNHTAHVIKSIRKILQHGRSEPMNSDMASEIWHLTDQEKVDYGYAKRFFICLGLAGLMLIAGCLVSGKAHAYSDTEVCQAIYKAEGGSHTRHPYGILTTYKHTSPKQACLNTVKHKRALWAQSGQKQPFIAFLGASYCPVGATNDPTGLNRNWIRNVSRFLTQVSV